MSAKPRLFSAARGDLRSPLLRWSVQAAAALTLAIFVLLIGYIVGHGVPCLNRDMFAWHYTSENVSMLPAVIVTVLTVLLSLLFAVPVGIGAAVYLTEYVRAGNPLVNVIRLAAECLTGIPSIIFGLFGFMFFVTACRMGFSLLAGSLTLALMVLPVIMRSTEEALRAVPDLWREGSFALGAGRLRTVFRVILPAAAPGITAGVLLSIGRIFGESAALLYTAGTVAAVPQSWFSSGRTLSVHLYALLCEGLHVDAAYATALVLLVITLCVNLGSRLVMSYFARESA